MKASNIQLDNNVSFLFKGSFGFGKTLAAASFAVDGPVYLAYWDKKSPIELTQYFTKKRFGDKAEKILDNITYDVYGSENAGDYLNKLIEFSVRGCPYFAVITDSVTFMTSGAVNWSLNFGKDPKVLKKIKDVLPSFDEFKVETSLVSQCIDISRTLPCNIIWTAHPIPRINVEGSGPSIKVTKANSIVSYGAKVAGMLPGGFTEIYHFSQASDWSAATGKASKRYIVNTESVGEEFAKSPLLGDYTKEFDITDKLFYEVWKEQMNLSRNAAITLTAPAAAELNESSMTSESSAIINPFQEKKWKV